MNTPTVLMSMLLSVWMVSFGPAYSQDPAAPDYYQDDPLIVVNVKDHNEFLAYSKLAGNWNRFTFPQGVKAQPVLNSGVCAFAMTGESISEIVAVDRMGNWRTTKLSVPAQKCTPFVDTNLTACLIDGRAYAFSAELGVWDSIDSPHMPALGSGMALIVTPKSIAVFSVHTGRWAVADITPRAVAAKKK